MLFSKASVSSEDIQRSIHFSCIALRALLYASVSSLVFSFGFMTYNPVSSLFFSLFIPKNSQREC